MNTFLRFSFAIVLILMVAASVPAQPPQIIWQMATNLGTDNDPAGLKETPDGGFVFGLTWQPQDTYWRAASVIKLTGDGDTVWQERIEPNLHGGNYIYDIDLDSHGRIWVCSLVSRGYYGKHPVITSLESDGTLHGQRIFTNHSRPRLMSIRAGAASTVALPGNYSYGRGITGIVNDQIETVWLQIWDEAHDISFFAVIPYQNGYLYGGWYDINYIYTPDSTVFVQTDVSGNVLMSDFSQQPYNTKLQSMTDLGPDGFAAVSVKEDSDQLVLSWYSQDAQYQSHVDLDLYRHPQALFEPGDYVLGAFCNMSDGGYLIGGRSDDNRAQLLRLDGSGDELWRYTMPQHSDFFGSTVEEVLLLSNGRIQIIGSLYNWSNATFLIQLAAEGETIPETDVKHKVLVIHERLD